MRSVTTSFVGAVLAVLTTSTGAMAQSYYDDQACRQYADAAVAPLRNQAGAQAGAETFGGALLGAGVGAAIGGAVGGGRGAGIGAASGAVFDKCATVMGCDLHQGQTAQTGVRTELSLPPGWRQRRMWEGVSAYATEEQARALGRVSRQLGTFIAELEKTLELSWPITDYVLGLPSRTSRIVRGCTLCFDPM